MSKKVLGTGGALFHLPSRAKQAVRQENDSDRNNWGKQCNSEGCFYCQGLTMDQLHVLIMFSVCGRDSIDFFLSLPMCVQAQARNGNVRNPAKPSHRVNSA